MGGGGDVAAPRRSPEVLAAVPTSVDVGLCVGVGFCSAASMSPFILTIDRSVTEAASGKRSMFEALRHATVEILTRPHVVLRSPALWMVIGVYGVTYSAANSIDALCERYQATSAQQTSAKLVGTTAVNMTASVLKDAAFARMFSKDSGAVEAGKKAAAVAKKVVPKSTYALFAFRDTLTIAGGFTVPPLMAAGMVQGGMSPDGAKYASQIISPMGMQIICTPVHLLALDMYNTQQATAGERLTNVGKNVSASIGVRMFRFLCAYGIGGLMNANLTARHRAWSAERYCGNKKKEAEHPDLVVASRVRD